MARGEARVVRAAWMGIVVALAWPGDGFAQGMGTVTPVDSVTLEEAVDRALRFAPQVVQASTGIRSAELQTRQAYAAMLPTLSVSSGASLSSSERFDPTTGLQVSNQSDSYNAGLSSRMDLFAGGRNLAAVRSARASEDAAEASLITQEFATALAAKQAYFAVLRAQELIRLNERRIEQAEEQLTAAQRRLEVGRATRSDVLRSQLERSNARQGLLQATTQYRESMYALGRTVGVIGPVTAIDPPTVEPAPLALSPEAIRALVLEEAPAVVSARADLRVAEAGVSQARAQWFPTVSVSGGYNWSNREFGLEQGLTSWSTRLSISYPIFNGLSRSVASDRANAQLTVAEAQADQAVRAAVAELESQLAALGLADEQVGILVESVEVAREDYRVQQERYTHGSATILELVSSQIALLQAEFDLINARYDYQIAKAQLESLVGREL